MWANLAEGLQCGNGIDMLNPKLTGIVRVSLSAMTTMGDVESFLDILDLFVERRDHVLGSLWEKIMESSRETSLEI